VCYEWDVSKVGNMSWMLFQASHFNQVRIRGRGTIRLKVGNSVNIKVVSTLMLRMPREENC